MKVRLKNALAQILMLILFTITSTPALASTNSPNKIDYVAMGDSCAAGVRAVPGQLPGWEESSDYGYTDMIAMWLEELGVLGKFDEKYSISGYTARQLAVETSKADGYQRLKKAEIVTLTVGANDLLGPLYAYFDACVAGEAELTIEGALAAIQEVEDYILAGGGIAMKDDIKAVLLNTLRANPDASIYVMGYYNPLPCLVDFGYDAAPYIMLIDDLIIGAIMEAMMVYPVASIDYIDTLGSINGILGYTGIFPSYSYSYDPDPNYPYYPSTSYLYADLAVPIADIHLTEAGHLMVALQFINAIEEDFDFIP
jgi:lysophospholipase L1-like esterase